MVQKENSRVLDENKETEEQRFLRASLADLLHQEAAALELVAHNIPDKALALVNLIADCKGKIIFSGCGKSGLIGKKLAATFSSLGLPSHALHPTDALHGDLGSVGTQDIFIGLSKSGKSLELDQLFHALYSQGTKTVLITCSERIFSPAVDVIITLPFSEEACYFKLAPTSSATVTMAFGHAIAMVASRQRGFTREDYARVHPAGALGRSLTGGTVRQFMKTGAALPLVQTDDRFTTIITRITEKNLGVALVLDHNQKIVGIITDGDIRRACLSYTVTANVLAEQIMTIAPHTIAPDELACHALKKMEDLKISSLVVLNNTMLAGLIHLHDLVQAGLRS